MSLTGIFTSGNILFVEDYDFGNVTEKNDKIVIILFGNEKNTFIIQTLTTSKNKTPFENIKHGCMNSKDGFFSFYKFDSGREVGIKSNNKPFSFNLDTFIFFRDNIRKIEVTSYLQYYGKVTILAKMNQVEYDRLIKCIIKSRHVKNKTKLELEQLLKINSF